MIELDSPPVDLPAVEHRTSPADVAMSESGGRMLFEGHAAVFDTESSEINGFRETISRGAFQKVLKTDPDVLFLGLEHNPLQPMARTTVRSGVGSLVLSEDTTGLEVRAELVPTTAAHDLKALMDSGVINQMSFSWKKGTVAERWRRDERAGYLRTITEFRSLIDVTPAVVPVYPGTSASMRSFACGIEIIDPAGEVQEQLLRDLAWKIHRGETTATSEERSAVDAAFKGTDTVSPWIAERALRAASQEPELQAVIPGLDDMPSVEVAYRLAARQRRLRAIRTT